MALSKIVPFVEMTTNVTNLMELTSIDRSYKVNDSVKSVQVITKLSLKGEIISQEEYELVEARRNYVKENKLGYMKNRD